MKSKIKHFALRMEIKMRIAVLSGKGRSRKNTSFCKFSCCCKKSTYIDCDVEEPNATTCFLNLHYQGEGNINKKFQKWIKRYAMVAVSVLNFAIITRLPMQKIK